MGFYLNEYLIANGVSLRKRVSELFDQLEQDRELAKVFVQNPIVVLQSKVFPEFPITDIKDSSVKQTIKENYQERIAGIVSSAWMEEVFIPKSFMK